MKKIIFAVSCIVALSACKKNNTPAPPGSPTGTSFPYAILPNIEYDGSWKRNGFIILDINHADNKDKKYMIINIEKDATGEYKFVLKKGPLPIDSLASNWPAEVRSVAFGLSNDIIINAHLRMQVQNFTSDKRFIYTYDSLHKFPTAILTYNYLNNPLYAGTMAGKKPDGRTGFWKSDGGYSKPTDIIFYFKEGYYTDVITIGNGAKPMVSLVDGISIVDAKWKEIDAIVTLEGPFYNHFYFDFDKWEYFVYRDFCPSTWGSPCTAGIQHIDFKSMDNLMKWPDGWGKK